MKVQTGIIVTYTVKKRLSHLEITNTYEFQARNYSSSMSYSWKCFRTAILEDRGTVLEY